MTRAMFFAFAQSAEEVGEFWNYHVEIFDISRAPDSCRRVLFLALILLFLFCFCSVWVVVLPAVPVLFCWWSLFWRSPKRRINRRRRCRAKRRVIQQLLAICLVWSVLAQETPISSVVSVLKHCHDLGQSPCKQFCDVKLYVHVFRHTSVRLEAAQCCLHAEGWKFVRIFGSVCETPFYAQVASRNSDFGFSWMMFQPCKGFPGEGPIQIMSANVTSAVKHASEISCFGNHADHELACVCMQETRIPEHSVRSMTKNFSSKGWTLHLGFQPQQKELRGKIAGYRQPTGGIATLCNAGFVATHVEMGSDWVLLGRVCHVLWVACGSCGFFVINCYLPTGKAAATVRVELMDAIFSYAATLNSHPVVLCGDFQSSPKENPSIVSAMMSDDWVDVYREQPALNLPVEATFTKTNWSSCSVGGGRTRIDFFLLNKFAMPLFKSVTVLRTAHLPNHAPCVLTLDLTVVSSKIWVVKPHPKWDLPEKPTKQSEWHAREEICYPVFMQFAERLIEASERLDVERVWDVACRIATAMINLIADDSLPSTRGSVPEFRQIPRIKRAVCSKFSIQLRKTTSLLAELRRKALAGVEDRSPAWINSLHGTILNCICSAKAMGVILVIDASSSQALLASCYDSEEKVFKHADEHDCKSKQHALKAWKEKLRKSSAGNKRHVHRWLKGERVGVPKMFQRPDKSFTSDVNEMLDMLSSFMGGIYNFHEGISPEKMEQDFYDKYKHAIDSLHSSATVPAICHHELFRKFQSKSPEKASGLDGRRVSELQQLPPSGWIGFAFTMRLAEAVGTWPQALKAVAVSSISKGLTMTEPKNVRCIGVAPLNILFMVIVAF